jgi:hypothetical protein
MRMASRKNERGGSTISNIVWLLGLAAALYAVWNVAPVYFDHYSFKDKVDELCRLDRFRNTDEQIMEKVLKEVRERKLTDYITRPNIQIRTLETSRSIRIDYERSAPLLPGVSPKKFRFSVLSDQPLM